MSDPVIFDATDPAKRSSAIARTAQVVRQGRIVVLPTDTVYGVGADAFDRTAVAMVLAAKHRGRDMPPPVLVGAPETVDGLATGIPDYARLLMRRFWPGALTLVFTAQPSLTWDLGETNGTVAVRMPQDDVALALLAAVGPMAVTSANVTGNPAAQDVHEAAAQLGAAVSAYLDGGRREGSAASTILDCTRESPIVLRHGALPVDDLQAVIGAEAIYDSPEAFLASRAASGLRLGQIRPSGVPFGEGLRVVPAPERAEAASGAANAETAGSTD